jgi:hypothetical protein
MSDKLELSANIMADYALLPNNAPRSRSSILDVDSGVP